jgi:hypothetical protein
MILVVRGTRSTQEVGSSNIDDSPKGQQQQQPRQTAEHAVARYGEEARVN